MSTSTADEAKLIAILRRHFQATIEMLQQVIDECSDEVWDVGDEPAPVWQQLYHSLIGIDFWFRDPQRDFQPQPFHTDQAGMLKGRAEHAIGREQIKVYCNIVSSQCEQLFERLTLADLVRDVDAGGVTLTLADHLLDQLRHVQHHLGSMHSQLRRRTGSYPEYVSYSERAFKAAQDGS